MNDHIPDPSPLYYAEAIQPRKGVRMSEQLNLPLTVDVPALEADEIVDIYHDDLEAGDVDPEGNAY